MKTWIVWRRDSNSVGWYIEVTCNSKPRAIRYVHENLSACLNLKPDTLTPGIAFKDKGGVQRILINSVDYLE